MVSEAPVLSDDDVDMVAEELVSRSSPSKKIPGKVPKRIHKAEREKLKRDHLNVLFLELGKTLEPGRQNNGKSSTLSDSIRLLRDLLAQAESLKRENATLLSESHYVTIEKDELKEDNSALEAQIGKLQSEIEERAHSQSSWRLDPSQSQNNTTTPQLLDHHLMLPVIDHPTQAASVVGPIFVVPLHEDPKPDTADATSKLPPNVSRPYARYPSPSDNWPSHILSEQPKVNQHAQYSSSSISSSSSSREEQGFSHV